MRIVRKWSVVALFGVLASAGFRSAPDANVIAASASRGPLDSIHALFDLLDPAIGPFPSDQFTVADADQLTGRRVNLPKPDCAERPSDCEDIAIINTLDGFNLQPRLSIPFDGPIDVRTVTSGTVFLISLGSTLRGRDDDGCDEDGRDDSGCEAGGPVIGINQVVWDTFTNTLHVESNECLTSTPAMRCHGDFGEDPRPD